MLAEVLLFVWIKLDHGRTGPQVAQAKSFEGNATHVLLEVIIYQSHNLLDCEVLPEH